MAICLYEHNQSAYRAAEAMLSSEGKAAVIHPTGTGKSFIGFKLCEDYPDKKDPGLCGELEAVDRGEEGVHSRGRRAS